MNLAGQAKLRSGSQGGYAMAALLVALSIMAIMMTVVMPVWKQTAQREKEEELVFRGKQYVHAIGMFQRKFANAYPPNVDALVEQRFLRKKFKDPITNDDFAPIAVGQGAPGLTPQSGQRGTTGTTGSTGAAAGRGQTTPPSTGSQPGGRSGPPTSTLPGTGTGGGGGISGVTSKSKDQSIRLYNGRGHYNEWAFVYVPQVQAPGAGAAPGAGVPGPGGQRGQPGQPPSPFGGPGVNPGQRGRGPGGPGGAGAPFGPNGPGSRGGAGGIGTFGGGGVTPVQPPTPRGRL